MIRLYTQRLLVPVCDGCQAAEGPAVLAGPEDETLAQQAARMARPVEKGFHRPEDAPDERGGWLCPVCRPPGCPF